MLQQNISSNTCSHSIVISSVSMMQMPQKFNYLLPTNITILNCQNSVYNKMTVIMHYNHRDHLNAVTNIKMENLQSPSGFSSVVS